MYRLSATSVSVSFSHRTITRCHYIIIYDAMPMTCLAKIILKYFNEYLVIKILICICSREQNNLD